MVSGRISLLYDVHHLILLANKVIYIDVHVRGIVQAFLYPLIPLFACSTWDMCKVSSVLLLKYLLAWWIAFVCSTYAIVCSCCCVC